MLYVNISYTVCCLICLKKCLTWVSEVEVIQSSKNNTKIHPSFRFLRFLDLGILPDLNKRRNQEPLSLALGCSRPFRILSMWSIICIPFKAILEGPGFGWTTTHKDQTEAQCLPHCQYQKHITGKVFNS